MNDVGLAANPDGDFRVILAGSLGVKPDLGLLAYDSLPLDDVLPLVVAVLRLFHAEGDRTNRSRAGCVTFGSDLATMLFGAAWKSFSRKKNGKAIGPRRRLRRVETETPLHERLLLPLGDIAPDMVFELVEAVRAVERRISAGTVPRFAHLCAKRSRH